jgi:anaerobic ribonucleoside-triphosphate reductase
MTDKYSIINKIDEDIESCPRASFGCEGILVKKGNKYTCPNCGWEMEWFGTKEALNTYLMRNAIQ